MKQGLFSLFVGMFFCLPVVAQVKAVAWDDVTKSAWGSEFHIVQIKSSADSTVQNAWLYKTKKNTPQPLIISLHTWSGNYMQEDPLAKETALRDWNYIHPDFRGANNHPDACGSALVMADIEDAIQFAIKNAAVDTGNVHIIGVSGGGYAAMLAYMKINYPVKSFSSWAGISNLADWYWESKGRHAKYATDIEQVAMNNGKMNWQSLSDRSPIKLTFPSAKRKNARLYIYTGVHDGYTGSVPISQSIFFYNKIAADINPVRQQELVAESTVTALLAQQLNPGADTTNKIGGRIIQLHKELPGVYLTVFEGGHEMLVPQALALLPADENKNIGALNILTIGDSNGAFDFGWPQQMLKLLPYANIVNKSIPGNTIGFDNLDQSKLNTLTNINQYLDDGYARMGENGQLDFIFINLGTNDTKNIFKDRQKEVAVNMLALLQKIKDYLKAHNKKVPHICIITPSPMDEQKIDQLKYGGGDGRIKKNNAHFIKLAAAQHVDLLNTYELLKPNFANKTTDGIHLNEQTQFQLASIIISYINSKNK